MLLGPMDRYSLGEMWNACWVGSVDVWFLVGVGTKVVHSFLPRRLH